MSGTTFTVTSETGTGTSDLTGLNNALAAIDVGGADAGIGNSYTISLGGDIALSQDLRRIA